MCLFRLKKQKTMFIVNNNYKAISYVPLSRSLSLSLCLSLSVSLSLSRSVYLSLSRFVLEICVMADYCQRQTQKLSDYYSNKFSQPFVAFVVRNCCYLRKSHNDQFVVPFFPNVESLLNRRAFPGNHIAQ